MNLRALRVFAFVMEEGTLARAAERMNLSQSAASRQLTLLEQDFDVSFFQRDKKRLSPTLEAERFYPEALRILSQIDALPEFVRHIGSDRPEPLRIVAQSRIVNGLVLPAIARFVDSLPGQPVKLEIHRRRDLGRRIMNDRYDVGVSALPLPVEQLRAHRLGAAALKVAVARDHPLARKKALTASDIADVPYIALDDTTVIRRIVDRELAAQGISIQVAHEVSLGAAAYRLVHRGLGFTFADPVALDPELSGDVALIDWNPRMEVEFGYFLPKSDVRAEAKDAFCEALEAVFQEGRQGARPLQAEA
ncbi:LysR family transcriptional regulator [uncultured Roseobacter sp.]|uniref:LysR family transcriptional regulator n=1 Tax=uncultured Roseobacter sp. TaxID=114847 RepID=UPI002631BF67|nr:LysR family transcriptional regulator [uncultured Roseobacter sp.]